MKTIVAAAVLGAIAWFLPIAAVDAAVRSLVVAIALMATGIFPCMTLTVNAMKGEEKSPAMVISLYDQLRTLLQILVVAFVFAVLTVILMASTTSALNSNALDWVVHALASASGAALGFFGSRVVAIVRAFFALLDINRTHALLVARKKMRTQRSDAVEDSRSEDLPKDDLKSRKLRRVK